MHEPSKSPKITGETRLFAILADPILHVKTPEDMNAFMQARGHDRVMVPIHVGPEQLALAVDGLRAMQNLDGFVVTVPHKSAIVALCDSLSPAARQVGAVNVVRRDADGRLHGDILDGVGFVAGLRSAAIEPSGLTVYMAGAGGAAQAIAFALAEAGVAKLTIANRTEAKAQQLVNRLTGLFPDVAFGVGAQDPSGHDLVVNATSMGLREADDYPCEVQRLGSGQIVAEIIMQPEQTPLLAAAAERGCRVHPGRPMLQCQIALMATAMGAGHE
ncbi:MULTISPECIES: shikimate dehydrogenase family protein [Pseudomonas]|jgi:shikimate dehydrogenase|uniref:shikimate dehydrogenase family protein n=1 Tax=Pseudomonas TaxID=286 RepID=UPI0018D6F42C|nr:MULTISPECIES: shikimate dehydrogenase [Pseudomonas]MBH3371730.1 shikimate dehydrogenase [Pseudomonas juntendi]MBS6036144.1 shikimate dehydrogenase [Pseudomonas sp.]CAH0648391.1 Shikimate dehydrogenase (NADP(+)) [Pseudomonas sp. Nvir]